MGGCGGMGWQGSGGGLGLGGLPGLVAVSDLCPGMGRGRGRWRVGEDGGA